MNRNPSPATRFGAGNQARAKQKGARDRLSAAFLKALADDFEANGVATIEKVRAEDPATYIRVVASLQPKEIELTRPMDDMTDDQLTEAIHAVAAALKARLPGSGHEDVSGKPTIN